ncbi:S8 family serine peptidase [Cloacibacillus evryensis]|uniref:S8 family serine peptidase n=1 Tax=Cloacibacillus evryensis TaxID=508460 RepID=UPI0004AD406F|nr:S8 family serine peptidase [Cloacibacillus evryensis]MCQ4764096.1 S8 family serine peptidase [Cloacibacillus evryensis]MEA5034866.1 S8 family serine peptidase [Cloacibacillus evryensis]
MKRTTKYIYLILTIFLLASAAFAYSANAAKAPKYVEGEALVVMKSSAVASAAGNTARTAQACSSAAASLAASVNASSVQTFDALSASSGKLFAHLRSDTKTADELISALKKNPNVIAASKNYISKAVKEPNDPMWRDQWGQKRIKAPEAWETTTGSGDVVAAVIDTGVTYDHPDLKDNMWRDEGGDRRYGMMFHDNGSATVITGTGGTANAAMTDWERVGDVSGHGTHVAGIIGAVGGNNTGVAGVNWKVKILTVGVFSYIPSWDDTGAYDSDTMNGLNYIAGLKRSGVNIVAANMSLGGARELQSDNSAYGQAIKAASKAGDKGILICMAAGNDGYNLDELTDDYGNEMRNYPSSYKFAATLSVGATASDDKIAIWSPQGSNYSPSGKWVDAFAPGSEILSTCRTTPLSEYPAGNQTYNYAGYTSISGTSMATPMVTGAAAMLSAAYPTKSAADIKALLINNATDVCKSGFSRYGQIDLAEAMKAGSADVVSVESIALSQAASSGSSAGKAAATGLSSTLYVDNTLDIQCTITPDNATNQILEWESSKEGVATVDADGMVTAHSGGTTVITARATDGSKIGSNPYSVTVIPVESVALNKSALSLAKGASETLTATAKPDNPSGYRVGWWSSDEEIATVDTGGVVTAVAAGTAAITAYVGDKSATCDVTVTNGGSGGGGGGGCSAGFPGLALLFAAALPAIYIKRR